jgi:hypothetical protein
VRPHVSAKREFASEKQLVYQSHVLTVNHYLLQLPDGREIERDIVERPESVLVLPLGQKNNVMLIEEYDLAADTWQLTLPGGKVIDPTLKEFGSKRKMSGGKRLVCVLVSSRTC